MTPQSKENQVIEWSVNAGRGTENRPQKPRIDGGEYTDYIEICQKSQAEKVAKIAIAIVKPIAIAAPIATGIAYGIYYLVSWLAANPWIMGVSLVAATLVGRVSLPGRNDEKKTTYGPERYPEPSQRSGGGGQTTNIVNHGTVNIYNR